MDKYCVICWVLTQRASSGDPVGVRNIIPRCMYIPTNRRNVRRTCVAFRVRFVMKDCVLRLDSITKSKNSKGCPWRRGLVVSVCHREGWSYGSWDRTPPGYRVVAFFQKIEFRTVQIVASCFRLIALYILGLHYTEDYFLFSFSTLLVRGCQIFRDTTYQNGKKLYQMTLKIPNDPKNTKWP
jgi:hypothetical protein